MVIQYLRIPPKPRKIQIFIKCTFQSSNIILSEHDVDNILGDVRKIKAVIQNKTGIAPEKQWLITTGGKTLEDGRTVSEYHIQNGSKA